MRTSFEACYRSRINREGVLSRESFVNYRYFKRGYYLTRGYYRSTKNEIHYCSELFPPCHKQQCIVIYAINAHVYMCIRFPALPIVIFTIINIILTVDIYLSSF